MYTIAIVGYGGMGGWHAKQLLSLPEEFRLAGVYDINPERIDAAEKEGIHGYRSLEELLADPEIRTVILAVPNNFHKPLSIQAMQAGKNVICEKPVMLNAAELEEVMAVAKETGRQFSVHQNRRWDKDFLIVKKIIEDGTIGKPFYIESRVQGSKGIPGDWRCVKEAGGGMLLDWGVHLIDQLMYLVDSPGRGGHLHLHQPAPLARFRRRGHRPGGRLLLHGEDREGPHRGNALGAGHCLHGGRPHPHHGPPAQRDH